MIVAYPDGSAAEVTTQDADRRLAARPDARVVQVLWDGARDRDRARATTTTVQAVHDRCRTLAAFAYRERQAIAEATLVSTIDVVARARGISKSSVLKMMREFKVRKRGR